MLNKVKKISTYAIISTMISASIVGNSHAITVKIPYRNTSINEKVDFSKLFEKSLSELLKLYKINIEKPVTDTVQDQNTTQDSTPVSEPTKQTQYIAPVPESEKPKGTQDTAPKPEPAKPTPAPVPKPEPVKPKPAPAPKPVQTSTTSGFSGYQQEVLNIVNKERSSRGLSSLSLSSEVSKVATIKSQDMISQGYFNHNSPTYGSPFDMMNQFGISYRAAGENIAMGQRTPQDVMTSWMNSDGHRKNILSSNFTSIGIGIAKDSNGRLYWTQMFIGK